MSSPMRSCPFWYSAITEHISRGLSQLDYQQVGTPPDVPRRSIFNTGIPWHMRRDDRDQVTSLSEECRRREPNHASAYHHNMLL